MASWGSLGHVTVAEPGALVGFLGPRVYEALYGQPFPEGVQTSENLYAHGHHRRGRRARRDRRHPRPGADHPAGAAATASRRSRSRRDEPIADVDTWDVDHPVPPRRTGPAYAGCCGTPPPTSSRSTAPARASPTPGCCSRWRGSATRRASSSARTGAARRADHPLGPEALREARRGMRLAERARAAAAHRHRHPGRGAVGRGRGGRAGRRDRPLASPTWSRSTRRRCRLMLGEGTGGGALALLPADRVVAAQHAWLSPLPPEGASAIVHRDLDHAPEMARAQRVRALDLHARRRSSTGSSPSGRTPPTSPRRSASGSVPCWSTSSARCWRPAPARPPTAPPATAEDQAAAQA